MATKKHSHTGFRNGDLFCFNCGRSYNMNMPQPVTMVTAMVNQFAKDHKYCEKTWFEPVACPDTENLSKSIADNARWWMQNGEHGTSSKTMFKYLHGVDLTGRWGDSHPHDPSDFRRCHLLLQAVPQWKNDLDKLRVISPVWSRLVDNWDKLTELLEDQMKHKKANGMYELMNSLGC